MSTGTSSVPDDFCIVHGRGAKVQRSAIGATDCGITWWECPQCQSASIAPTPAPAVPEIEKLTEALFNAAYADGLAAIEPEPRSYRVRTALAAIVSAFSRLVEERDAERANVNTLRKVNIGLCDQLAALRRSTTPGD